MGRIGVRFTVRRLMILVALAGLTFGVPIEIARLRRLSEEYRIRAARLGGRESRARSDAILGQAEWAAKVREMDREERERGGWYKMARPSSPERARRLIPHFEALRRKYERVAWYPWLPLERDPPSPE